MPETVEGAESRSYKKKNFPLTTKVQLERYTNRCIMSVYLWRLCYDGRYEKYCRNIQGGLTRTSQSKLSFTGWLVSIQSERTRFSG